MGCMARPAMHGKQPLLAANRREPSVVISWACHICCMPSSCNFKARRVAFNRWFQQRSGKSGVHTQDAPGSGTHRSRAVPLPSLIKAAAVLTLSAICLRCSGSCKRSRQPWGQPRLELRVTAPSWRHWPPAEPLRPQQRRSDG